MSVIAWVLSFIVAYFGSRAILSAFGFHYSLFRDPFDLGKLVIDLGVWLAVAVPAKWVFDRLFARRRRTSL